MSGDGSPMRTVRGLAVGFLGGALFWLLGMPAPWLAGSMIGVVIAIFSGIEIGMPAWLRAAAFIFLGIQTGTSVTWETMGRASQWPLSIALLALTVIAVTWAGMQFYLRSGRHERATALFASLPGALSLVLLLAEEAKADMRRVAISQCIRLIFLIAALPALITFLSPAAATLAQQTIQSIAGLAILIVLASAAGLVFERLKIPAGLLLGPTLAAVALELSGVVQGSPPPAILIPANIVLGIMIAVRFGSFRLTELREALGEGFTAFLLALAVAAAGAGIASLATGLPFALTLLAYSPGGLDAMIILAFALDLDPAYVGAHQIARYLGLSLLMPLVAGLILRRGRSLNED